MITSLELGGSADKFRIQFDGGETNDCDKDKIVFQKLDENSSDVFKRNYTTALTAFVNKCKVNIFTTSQATNNDRCRLADIIEIFECNVGSS